jgi:hypothetical protein
VNVEWSDAAPDVPEPRPSPVFEELWERYVLAAARAVDDPVAFLRASQTLRAYVARLEAELAERRARRDVTVELDHEALCDLLPDIVRATMEEYDRQLEEREKEDEPWRASLEEPEEDGPWR